MLDIVIPVYNEDKGILRLFDEIEHEIGVDKHLIIVYDHDEDTTVPVINNRPDKYTFKIDLVKNRYGAGALNAIKTGLLCASEEMVLVMMADSSDKLDVVDEMCAMMKRGYDLVCGSRYMPGGKQHGGPWLKCFFSRTAGITLNLLTGIPTHDCTNSFKMYRTDMLKNITIESTGGFEIGLELVCKAYIKGYKIGEIPSEWFDREDGQSNFHMWKWMPRYIYWYLYCVKNTWFGGKGR